MNGKSLLSVLFLVLSIAFPALSQGDATSRIYIQVLQPERDNIPAEAAKQLENKLSQLVTANGIAEVDPANRFVLTSKASIVTKDVVPGPPAKVSMNIDFTFMVGDVIENKVYESVTVSTIGVGINENKAFIAAIKNVKPKNPDLVSFLSNAKKEIVDYYTSRCSQIKQEAEREAAAHNFDKAIYMLMQVPDICDCAGDCQSLAIQYNRDKIDTHAASLLNKAKAAWAESPDEIGAANAADYLSQIPGGTSSQKGVDALAAEIDAKLQADQKRAWQFKMQQYRDQVEKQKRDDQARLEQQRADNEYRAEQQRADNERRAIQQQADNERRAKQQQADIQYRQNQQAANNAARAQLIEACRQVGVAYANNQPKSVTYQRNVILW